ncbi:MAG: hypothetical protein HRT44_07160 [Bdellovibrionales bacterium]|nr:hypothetical protein [Bdellovibrionales bacterium]NQZ19015.1 hypothetical protein [Bdellovibrionales bacterium]
MKTKKEVIAFVRQSLPERVFSSSFLETCADTLSSEELFALLQLVFKEFQRFPGLDFVSVINETVDQSNYDLVQWLKALCHFQHWLNQSQSQAPLPEMIRYLSCAEQAPDNKNLGFALEDLLKVMLCEYGFHAAKKV